MRDEGRIKIYNTLTRKKEVFKPQEGVVKIYTCGVTVYDDCHIGHARSLYVFEVMRQYLKYRKFKVKFVRNITDIDDKIINRAKELNTDWRKLADEYIENYYRDLKNLGISEADEEPRATENIEEMIEYIAKLIDKEYAYVADSGVYFSVRKFSDYGKLSAQSIDEMRSGVRIEADKTKRDPLDFALWKKAKEGEPSWDSPWGEGRPGWHIECSVMSQKELKAQTLDIHGGGRDLIFPHHENEIAQSESLTGRPFANYWMHHGLLTINGQKMAKSLGNFVTISDVLAKYSAETLKIFYLQAHYSSSIDFSWEKLKEAKRAYNRISILLGKLEDMFGSDCINAQENAEDVEGLKQQFIESMDDDFNMPMGLAALFDIVGMCNKLLERNNEADDFKLRYAMNTIKQISGIFCLTFPARKQSQMSEEELERKIQLRLEYRRKKDFKKADQIRRELEQKGIILEDTKDGKTIARQK